MTESVDIYEPGAPPSRRQRRPVELLLDVEAGVQFGGCEENREQNSKVDICFGTSKKTRMKVADIYFAAGTVRWYD